MTQLTRRRYAVVRTFATVGVVTGGVAGFVLGLVDHIGLPGPTLRGALIGLLTGAAAGAIEVVYLPRWTRRLGFLLLNVVHLASYAIVISGSLVIVNTLSRAAEEPESLLLALQDYVGDPLLVRDFMVAATLAPVLVLILQVRRLLNPGELSGLLSGAYYYPVEESRVFLFADLRGSTTLAEHLGHLRFSALLRDFFADLSEPVLAWGGHVYQYEGDGCIISWRAEEGLRDAACVQCFFEMCRALERREPVYQERYGAAPSITGGLHGGLVVTTWVGEMKRELAHHGVAMNAASRIQGLCRDYGVDLLVSSWVLERTNVPPGTRAVPKGNVLLRGKTMPLELFALEEGAAR